MDGKAISGYNPGSGVSVGGQLSASAPITLSAELNIGLSTVPITKGGTGMSAVGPPSTVLTSNGTILAWTPITTGGTVTSVSASTPLQVSGPATDPVVSLQTNPTINNPTFTTPKLGSAEATSLKITSLDASRLVLSDADKNLSSVTSSGSAGQVLTISEGVPSWQTPSFTGTVTSVGLQVPSIFQVSPSAITSSGTFNITTTTTPQGSGAIVLANSPTLTTPILGAAEATSLKVTGLTASRIVLTDGDKNLSSVTSSGTSGQVLTISGGVIGWQTPATPSTGTVTSVSLTTGSPLFTTSGTVTTSGNLSFTTATAPSGTGTKLVLANAPTIDGTVVLTDQQTQVLTFTGGNLRPAYIGCTTTGANFGSSLMMGVNQFGTSGGNSYNIGQHGGSYSITSDTLVLHTWIGKIAGANTNNVIMTLSSAGVLQLPGLTASRLVLTDSSKNISSLTSAGTEGQVLAISAGAPTWTTLPTPSTTYAGLTTTSSLFTINNTTLSTTGTNSINLVSAPTGTGTSLVLATSPTILTPTLAYGINTPAVTTQTAPNSTACYISVNSQLPTGSQHLLRFGRDVSAFNMATLDFNYNAANTTANTLGFGFISAPNLMFLSGSGNLTLNSLTASRLVLTDGSKNLTSVTTAGANGQFLGFSGGIPAWLNLPTFNFARYSMLGGGAPWPANGGFYIGCKNWTGVDGIGEDLTSLSSLTLEGGWTYEGPFRNLSGRKLYVHVCWSVKRDFDGASAADIRLTTYALAGSGSPATPTAFQTQQIVGSSYASVSGIVTIENNGFMVLEGKQLSGVGNNFIDGNVQYTILS